MANSIANKLKMLRKAKMSQDEMAQRSGVPIATIQRIESGRSHDYRDIEAITKVLGTNPAALWDPPGESLSPTAISGPMTAMDAALVLRKIAEASPAQRGLLFAILFQDRNLALPLEQRSYPELMQGLRRGG